MFLFLKFGVVTANVSGFRQPHAFASKIFSVLLCFDFFCARFLKVEARSGALGRAEVAGFGIASELFGIFFYRMSIQMSIKCPLFVAVDGPFSTGHLMDYKSSTLSFKMSRIMLVVWAKQTTTTTCSTAAWDPQANAPCAPSRKTLQITEFSTAQPTCLKEKSSPEPSGQWASPSPYPQWSASPTSPQPTTLQLHQPW